jgi:hypothetical protein
MVQTRTQSRVEAGGTPASSPKKASATKRTSGSDEISKPSKKVPQKRKLPEDEHLKRPENPKELPSKAPRASKSSPSNPTILKLLSSYETTPLYDIGLQEPLKPTSSTALAHIFNALLLSTRISHAIAAKTLSSIVSAGWCDLPTLQKTTWKERTEILTKGGYTHYREKTATGLGDLAIFLEEEYEGDAARLISGEDNETDGEQKRRAVSGRLKEIKGLGPLGVEIFLETAQAVWPCLAPFMGERDLKALREMGVEESIENIYVSLDKDSKKMSRLCAAIAKARLEDKKGDFT